MPMFAVGVLGAGLIGASKLIKSSLASKPMWGSIFETTGDIWPKMMPISGPFATAGGVGKSLKFSLEKGAVKKGMINKINKSIAGGPDEIINRGGRNVVSSVYKMAKETKNRELAAAARSYRGEHVSKAFRTLSEGASTQQKSMHEIMGIYRRTLTHGLDQSAVAHRVSRTLSEHGFSSEHFNRLTDVIHNQTSSGWEALGMATDAKKYLMGPSLASNMAVMALPGTIGIGSTIAVARAAHRGAESMYRGFGGGR